MHSPCFLTFGLWTTYSEEPLAPTPHWLAPTPGVAGTDPSLAGTDPWGGWHRPLTG